MQLAVNVESSDVERQAGLEEIDAGCGFHPEAVGGMRKRSTSPGNPPATNSLA